MKQYVTALVLGIGLVGCTASDRAEVRQESKEVGAETRARTAEAKQEAGAKRREYQERWQARLDRIDREMDEERAKVKGRKLTAKQRAEYNKRMAELEKGKKETHEKWEQVKNATDENWEQFKDALDTAGDQLENGWNRFVADMKS
jgi:Skp family chaperone for outer membrane proteins